MLKYTWIIFFLCSCRGATNQTAETTEVTMETTDSITAPALPASPPDFKTDYIGKIGKTNNVFFQLQNANGAVTGTYLYSKIGIDIPVRGQLNNDRLILYEIDDKNDTVAIINAAMENDSIKGTWKKTNENTSYPLVLKKSRVAVAPIPADIAGTYYISEAEQNDCKLEIVVTREKEEYSYQLKTTKRNIRGKLVFTRTENPNEVYMHFTGLPWDSYKGDISKGKRDAKVEEKPQSIEAMYADGEMDIQNTGNAMNSYEKLSECGEKYLHLVKKQ